MKLTIIKIITDNIGNQNIRTYIADKEDVIIDFIGMISGKYDIADIEAIIDRCVCQGNSMDVGYKANNMKDVHYRIKFIDDYYRNVRIDI